MAEQRLIDANALIARCGSWYTEEGTEEGFIGTLKNILDMMPTIEPEQQWIPCSERLPEVDGEKYLVTDYCEQINRKRIHISSCYVNREGFWSEVPLGYKVIAWMPLPKPWRGEEHD